MLNYTREALSRLEMVEQPVWRDGDERVLMVAQTYATLAVALQLEKMVEVMGELYDMLKREGLCV
jgi:hypothetical protein